MKFHLQHACLIRGFLMLALTSACISIVYLRTQDHLSSLRGRKKTGFVDGPVLLGHDTSDSQAQLGQRRLPGASADITATMPGLKRRPSGDSHEFLLLPLDMAQSQTSTLTTAVCCIHVVVPADNVSESYSSVNMTTPANDDDVIHSRKGPLGQETVIGSRSRRDEIRHT